MIHIVKGTCKDFLKIEQILLDTKEKIDTLASYKNSDISFFIEKIAEKYNISSLIFDSDKQHLETNIKIMEINCE